MKQVLPLTDLTSGQKFVLWVMAWHAHQGGSNAYPAVATLAEECRLSERQVQRILKQLVEAGHLHIEAPSTRYFPTRYRVTPVPSGVTSDAPGVTPGVTSATEKVSSMSPKRSEKGERSYERQCDASSEDRDSYSLPHWKELLGSAYKPLTSPQYRALRRIEDAYLTHQDDLFILMDTAALKDKPLAWLLAVAPTWMRHQGAGRVFRSALPAPVDYDAFARELQNERSRHVQTKRPAPDQRALPE